MRTTPVRRARSTVVAAAACLLLVACSQQPTSSDPSRAAESTRPSSSGTAAPTVEGVAMEKPGPFTGASVSPDILVYSPKPLDSAAAKAVAKVKGVTDVDAFSMAQFFAQGGSSAPTTPTTPTGPTASPSAGAAGEGDAGSSSERNVTYAAVDPATFRKFTPNGSAKTQEVWDRVAGGEMAVDPELGKALQDANGFVQMGNDTGAPKVHIGAYATLVDRATGAPVIDAVVNEKWAKRLGMQKDNALLVSTGETAPREVIKQVQKIVGSKASVQILAVDLDITAYQTAVITGGSVSEALGTLRYTANANGSVNPDPAWVANFIRTEQVPLLGSVRCNKVMLPELRAALTEIVARGLADKIHVNEYGGCYVPRYIAGTTSLSFHTFGTAIDINVPGNLRGTRGEMDRTVVSIFKKWGFAWGGDWHYTDPMHFELHKIVVPS